MQALFQALVALTSLGHPGRSVTPGCLNNHPEMPAFVLIVKSHIAERTGTTWHGLKFTPSDTTTVRPVQDDSVCDLARETLVHYLAKEAMPSRFILVSAGDYFIAEWAPDGETHSEFRPQYFFDRTLKKVLFPCRNGSASC